MKRFKQLFSSHRTRNIRNITKQKGKFPQVVEKVIDTSDIVLQILDARYIDETRNIDVENSIKEKGKRLIYVINKADLVNQRSKIEEAKKLQILPYLFVSSKKRTGIKRLRDKIKMESRKIDIGEKDRIQVGIIGYPNTGKSSLINVLSGRSSAKTGAQAGFTKGLQKISLTKNILLLDTPGVIQESEYSHSEKSAIQKHAKVGARTIDKIRDPEMVISELMKENSKKIEKFYKIGAEGDPEVLIEELGKIRGYLKKGGKVDDNRTSKQIIQDWQSGKIK